LINSNLPTKFNGKKKKKKKKKEKKEEEKNEKTVPSLFG